MDLNGAIAQAFDQTNGAIRVSAVNDAVSLGPGSMITAATVVTTNDVPRIQFPDAATTTAYATLTIPNTWTACNVGLIWSGTTAGTNPVRWQVSVKKLDIFVDLITEAFFQDVFLNAATQTTANQVKADNVIAAMDVTPFALGDAYSVRVQRIGADAADTYTGIAELLGVNLQRV
jgi:hypothetical protein